jgi:hypothetical protein
MQCSVDVKNKRINELEELIWNYHLTHHQLQKSDHILVLGCHDEGVGIWAADHFCETWAE